MAFFDACLNMRDWIRYDRALDQKFDKLVCKYVNETPALALCRDLAIGEKHLAVSKPLTDEDPQLVANKKILLALDEPSGPDDPPPMISVHFTVQTDTGERDALELATECMQAWTEFFRIHNL